VLTLRIALEVAVLVWSVVAIVRLGVRARVTSVPIVPAAGRMDA
jgi:hypothetical protein